MSYHEFKKREEEKSNREKYCVHARESREELFHEAITARPAVASFASIPTAGGSATISSMQIIQKKSRKHD